MQCRCDIGCASAVDFVVFGSCLKFGSCLVRGWFVLGSFLMFTLHVFRTVRIILPSCVWHVWMSAYARAPCNRELTPDDTCHCPGRPPAAGYHQPDRPPSRSSPRPTQHLSMSPSSSSRVAAAEYPSPLRSRCLPGLQRCPTSSWACVRTAPSSTTCWKLCDICVSAHIVWKSSLLFHVRPLLLPTARLGRVCLSLHGCENLL